MSANMVVYQSALKLPKPDRRRLAGDLLASLTGRLRKTDLSSDQMVEIDRRLADYHAGKSRTVDAFQALTRLEQRIAKRAK